MKPRLYFDTSVFGGVYDDEFSEITILLFDKVKSGGIICVYSDLSLVELNNAPQKVKDFFSSTTEAKYGICTSNSRSL